MGDVGQIAPRPIVSGTTNYLIVRYLQEQAELSGDSSAPLTPDPWIEYVIEHACYLAWRSRGDLEAAGAALAAANRVLEAALRTPELRIGLEESDDSGRLVAGPEAD